MVSFINPKNSIRQIAKACNMTDTEIRRVVYGLLQAGLVELTKPPTIQQAAKTPARAAKLRRQPVERSLVERLIARIKEV